MGYPFSVPEWKVAGSEIFHTEWTLLALTWRRKSVSYFYIQKKILNATITTQRIIRVPTSWLSKISARSSLFRRQSPMKSESHARQGNTSLSSLLMFVTSISSSSHECFFSRPSCWNSSLQPKSFYAICTSSSHKTKFFFFLQNT